MATSDELLQKKPDELGNSYFIDAHCHITPPWFSSKEDMTDIKNNALSAGVEKAYNVACEPSSYQWVLDNADEFYKVCLGLQPTDISSSNQDNFSEVLEENHSKVNALGEVGLDYYWIKEHKEREKQSHYLRELVEVANNYNLPLVIHSRKAEKESIDLLQKYAGQNVMMHCFEGNIELVKRAVDQGWIISSPTITIRRRKFRRVVKNTPLEQLVLETDSPFLSPLEHIQKNQPASVLLLGKYLSQLLEIPLVEIAKRTTKNAELFFK